MQLKPCPCPFCGHNECTVDFFHGQTTFRSVWCSECGAQGPSAEAQYRDDDYIIKLWNRRQLFTSEELANFQKEFNETKPLPASESEIDKIVDAMVPPKLNPCEKNYNCTCTDRTTCRMMIEARDRCIQEQAKIISDLRTNRKE